MVKSTEVITNDLQIRAIVYDDGGCFTVGEHGCTKIVLYDEYPVGDPEPYFAVYKGDKIFCSVKFSAIVQINYQ